MTSFVLRRNIRIRLVVLRLLLALVCSSMTMGGCSRVFTPAAAPAPSSAPAGSKQWTCDPLADDALERENIVDAIRLHLGFLQSHPDNGLAYYHLGFAFGQSGDQGSETKYYEKAVELGYAENNIFYNLGMAYGEQKQYDKAERMFQRALELNRTDAEPHFGLGLLYQSRGDEPRAEQELQQAIALDPKHTDARATLAMLFAKAGKRDQAMAQLKAVLDIDPEHRLARELYERLSKQ